MATVCSFCGQELPRGGEARFCTHCGTPVPRSSSASPDAQVAKNDIPVTNNNQSLRNPNPGWHEQLAEQPSARSVQPQDPNVTPWLGLPGGSDAGNVTPWLGLPSAPEPARVTLDGRRFGTQAAGVQSPLRAPRKQKRSWLVGSIAAVVLLILAIGCWIILAQPFTVSADTNPSQTSSSAPLGLTITYPASWTVTQTATTLTLADSSDTAQMKIVQSANANTDQAGYLYQQATKLGMTDAKAGATISFAGSSWQQTHGDFVIDGAGYIGTIYVTTHNNHLYTLTQIAPKVTFQDEESLIFAPARASLTFK